MTRVLESQFFTPIELDFLWEALGGADLPFPLTLKQHGETEGHRSMLRRETMTALAARHLVSMTGRLDAELEDLLTVLARPETAIDSLFLPEDGAEQAVAAWAGRIGDNAVVVLQDEQGIELRQVRADAMAGELVAMLPAERRGTETSVSLPVGEFTIGAVRRPAASESEQHSREIAYRLLTERNVRYGEFAVSARDPLHGTMVRTPVLTWSDKPSGRYISYVRAGWRTIAPADAGMIRHQLGEMTAEVQRLAAG